MAIQLDVPLIEQRPELPTGCEITAVTMMLNYAGADVDKVGLAHEMPYDKFDCNKGFVGDPFTNDGDSIYPPALMALVKKYAGSPTNLTGKSLADLMMYLQKSRHPIVTWVGDFDGFKTHALLMTGFNDSQIFYNDCWTDERTSLSREKFEEIYVKLGQRAISYL